MVHPSTYPKPGGGKPLRGRKDPLVWGLKSLSSDEQIKCDGDSILLLRQMYLYHVAKTSCPEAVAFLRPTRFATSVILQSKARMRIKTYSQ